MNLTTLWQLTVREYYERRLRFFWLMSGMLLVLLLVFLNKLYTADSLAMLCLLQTLFACFAIYVASLVFWELKTPTSARRYFLIPATILEKTIVKISVYCFIWWFLFIFCCLLAYLLAVSVFWLYYGNIVQNSIWNGFFDIIKALLTTLYSVCLLQFITIFANCYFKKSALTKLTICILGLAMLLTAIVVAEGMWLIKHFSLSLITSSEIFKNIDQIPVVLSWSLKLLLLVIIAGLTYLRLRETEVN